jgi:hypothetical protein
MPLYSKTQYLQNFPDTVCTLSGSASHYTSNRTCIKWSDEENRVLMKEINNGIGLEDIAKYHQRTIISVKYHIMSHALNIMKEKKISLYEVSKLVNISVNDLKNYKQYQEEKKNKISLHQIIKLELEILDKQKKLNLEMKKLEIRKLELELKKLELKNSLAQY